MPVKSRQKPRPYIAEDRVEEAIRLQEQMNNVRGNFNTLWQSVAQRVMPNYSDFIMQWAEGQRRTNLVFDSTAPLALEHFCAAMESMLCPASTRWHRLRPADPSLQNDPVVMMYMDDITDVLFRARYAPTANFQSQVHESFAQTGAFGNGPMLVDDVPGFGLRYRAMHLAETYGMENAVGVIDRVHRKYQLTAQAAVDAEDRGIFEPGSVPEGIRSEAERGDPTTKHWFLHCIYPNPDHNPRSRLSKAFTSLQICVEERCLLAEKGYTSQPILFPRYRVNPKETYGRGPGCDVLPEILMLNEAAKLYIRQAQRAISPPILLADDGSLPAFDVRSNAFNYGMLSPDGKPLAVPFMTGGNFEVAGDFLKRVADKIERAFLVDIFSILEDPKQDMTATEVLQRAQEKGYLLAPMIGRQQSELFGPMITREIDILDRAGLLPPPPDKVRRMGKLDMEVVYESEIQVTQRKTKALAIAATVQQAEPLMQFNPKLASRFNTERMLSIIGDSNGAPAAIFNTPEENQAQDEAALQQQQLTNMAQLAGPASQAIKNIAQAQQAGGTPVPGNLPA
jgi:hypothetical protein